MNKEIKRTIIVLSLLCSVFVGLIGYMSYFQVFKAEAIKNNPYNKRLWVNEENVLRGSIMDRNGKLLVYSEKKDKINKRYYKYGNLYSHIIGYSYREYGKSALELSYNNTLLNISENVAINEIKNLIAPSSVGNNLKLTIDHNVQEKSRSLLKGKKGSIITMNPTNGEIYSMVSLPDFDTSNLQDEWKSISEDSNSPLLNRATQGLYIPGSVFKIITTASALETLDLDMNHICNGSTEIDGYTFKDYNSNAHGNISIEEAFSKSCNTYYTEKAQIIGKEKLGNISDRFMINNNIPFDLPTKKSVFPYKENLGKTDISAAAIGQGKVLVTPLNMVLIASTIANNGEMVRPIIVKEVLNKDDKIIRTNKTDIISKAVSNNISNEIKDMMVEVVKTGTGKNANIKNVQVAGKTGTAENPSGKDHAWFVGFAPAEDPKIAVVVILEEEGVSGGTSAAPIARDILIYGLNNLNF